ncbi:MAG: sugar phosphate isomerase/epimerase [Cyclobacteriaceae bacterium]|nr:sugar phosphate isomerase/epimerase [Cyclobacteriaceae bacterium]
MVIKRRGFLKSSGRGLGLAFFSGPLGVMLNACNNRPSILTDITIGAHPWVYAASLPKYDITPVLPQIFADIKYAGLGGVELMHDPLRNDATTARIIELKEEHNMPVIGTSYGASMWDREKHSEILDDVERIIINLEKTGGKTMGTSVGSSGELKTEEQLDAQAELLQKIMVICKDHGIVLNLHNHTYEVENHLHDLKGTLKRIPDAPLGPDLNWLIRGGVDPVEFINTYGHKMVFCHLRNQDSLGKWTEDLKTGVMDYPGVAHALQKVNFKGYAVIELAHENDFKTTRPIRESLKISREYFESLFKF